jgi:hypothetical protein
MDMWGHLAEIFHGLSTKKKHKNNVIPFHTKKSAKPKLQRQFLKDRDNVILLEEKRNKHSKHKDQLMIWPL